MDAVQSGIEGEVMRVPKGRGEYIVASISEYKGKNRADVRIYYTDKNDELKPTQKGVSVPVEDIDVLERLVAALRESV